MGIFSHFDATYIKANDPITKRAFWLREQRTGKSIRHWAVLTDPSWTEPRVLETVHTDFHWDDPGKSLRLMPSWMYALPVPTKYESLHWNGRISGYIQFDGGEWPMTHWPAQQGHLWGWRTSREWAWAHGNCFQEDHTAAFEILTSGNRTVLCFQSQQFQYLANGISTLHCTQHELTDTHWNWTFSHHDLVIAGQFRLGYADMATVIYPTPQGDTRTCHNTKVGAGVIEVARGGKPLLQLTAVDTLAWEWVR